MLQYEALSEEAWFLKLLGAGVEPLLSLPPEDLQKSTVGKSGASALRDAWMFWQFIRRMAESHGKPINADTRVLDFGVSWGRILRFFLRDIEARNLSGVDVTERFLKEAKASLPAECDLRVSSPAPPLDYADNTFDVIYAFSVFSHLPESLTNDWVSEFKRILKPGGIACLTTRPKAHIQSDDIKRLSDGNAALYERKYDAGDFVFLGGDGGRGLNQDIYGEAAIPPAYARHWPLELVSFEEKYSETYLQPCFVLRKS
jgi:SAM-dependent methyltransferase